MRAFQAVSALFLSSLLATAFLASEAHADPPAAPPAAAAKPAAKKPAARTDVAVGAALARLERGVTLVPAASQASGSAPASTAASRPLVQQSGGSDLADIRVTRQAASDRAGEARNVEPAISGPAGPAKPIASVRHERKLAVAKTMASLAPAFDACRAQGGATSGATVAVHVEIGAAGAVESAQVVSVTGPLAKEAAQCMAHAFDSAKFGAPGGQGVQLTVPVTVAASRAEPPAPVAAADTAS